MYICIMRKMRTAPALLKSWRKAQGMTQLEAAKVLSVNQPRWSRFEGGESVPNVDEANRIARMTDGAVPVEAWEDRPEPTAKAS